MPADGKRMSSSLVVFCYEEAWTRRLGENDGKLKEGGFNKAVPYLKFLFVCGNGKPLNLKKKKLWYAKKLV